VLSKLLLTALLIAGAVAWSPVAHAQDGPAAAPGDDKRPNAALAACASGDVAKGIAILGELYAETRNPSYVFNQARCHQKNNQLEQARSSFAEYLRIGTSEPPEDIQRAQGFIKELDDAIARQRAAAPPPVIVTPAQPSGAERAHTLRVTSIVLAGVGVAAIVTGAVMSLKVKSINDDINREFAGQDYVTDGARLQQQLSDGARYETWQWVGYGVGVAAMAGAATTFILSARHGSAAEPAAQRTAEVAPALSPNGMGGVVRVRF
jgi:hypothetical protein